MASDRTASDRQELGFDDEARRGVYRAIYERRDVRSHFLPDPVSDEILGRILDAAHHAPSVGMMQPWEFILIRDTAVRQKVHEAFDRAREAASQIYPNDARRTLYFSLKLAGILDAPVNICVVCDPSSGRGHGLGRQTMPETPMYSTVCAVQNLWLAARAEGIGVGWVSIVEGPELKELLNIPEHIVLVAYLCIGHVSQFDAQPELDAKGWERRISLARQVHFESYGAIDEAHVNAMLQGLPRV
jgi:5,6-dimethylbenzimidazole synthase